MEEKRSHKVASSRVTSEQNLAFVDFERVDEVLITCDSFDKLRRVFVLGSET